MTQRQTTRRRSEPGFTLVEVLTVIVIVAIVMGLVLGGVAKIKEGAKETHARTLLSGLLGCEGMYETATGLPVEHLTSTKPGQRIDWTTPKRRNVQNFTPLSADIDGDDIAGQANDFSDGDGTYTSADNDNDMEQANLYMERFIWAVNQMPTVRKMLPSLGKGFDDTELDINNVPAGDGFLEVVDPWGNPIAYASKVSHANDPNLVNNGNDDDFLPEHDAPFFASAGKDQRWGQPKKRGDFTDFSPGGAWETYKDSDEYKFTRDNLYSFDLERTAATRED